MKRIALSIMITLLLMVINIQYSYSQNINEINVFDVFTFELNEVIIISEDVNAGLVDTDEDIYWLLKAAVQNNSGRRICFGANDFQLYPRRPTGPLPLDPIGEALADLSFVFGQPLNTYNSRIGDQVRDLTGYPYPGRFTDLCSDQNEITPLYLVVDPAIIISLGFSRFETGQYSADQAFSLSWNSMTIGYIEFHGIEVRTVSIGSREFESPTLSFNLFGSNFGANSASLQVETPQFTFQITQASYESWFEEYELIPLPFVSNQVRVYLSVFLMLLFRVDEAINSSVMGCLQICNHNILLAGEIQNLDANELCIAANEFEMGGYRTRINGNSIWLFADANQQSMRLGRHIYSTIFSQFNDITSNEEACLPPHGRATVVIRFNDVRVREITLRYRTLPVANLNIEFSEENGVSISDNGGIFRVTDTVYDNTVQEVISTFEVPIPNCNGNREATNTTSYSENKIREYSFDLSFSMNLDLQAADLLRGLIDAQIRAELETLYSESEREEIQITSSITLQAAPESYVVYTLGWILVKKEGTITSTDSLGNELTIPFLIDDFLFLTTVDSRLENCN